MDELLSSAELDRLQIVLVSPRNPLNIGAAARAMSNFGFARLAVVNPYEVAFREARSAVGASEILTAAQEFKSVGEAIADCSLVVGTTAVRKRNLHHELQQLDKEGGSLIREQLHSQRVALLFGSERFGLGNQDLSHCHWLLRIPTRETQISMNLGQAVAVCLYELVRGEPAGASTPAIPDLHFATSSEVERSTEALLEALRLSGYVKPDMEPLTEEKVRRLMRRLSLQSSDSEMLVGMLRQILWKLKN